MTSIERKLIYMSITSHRFGFLCSSYNFLPHISCWNALHITFCNLLLLLYFVGMRFMHGNLIEIYLVAEMSQSTMWFRVEEIFMKFHLTQKLLDQSNRYSIPSETKK